jgi:hypothetical protein
MESQGAIAEEGTETFEGGCEVIGIGCGEGIRGDLSVLSSKITYLAGLWKRLVAWRCLEVISVLYLL